jgi:hypothetical protein
VRSMLNRTHPRSMLTGQCNPVLPSLLPPKPAPCWLVPAIIGTPDMRSTTALLLHHCQQWMRVACGSGGVLLLSIYQVVYLL